MPDVSAPDERAGISYIRKHPKAFLISFGVFYVLVFNRLCGPFLPALRPFSPVSRPIVPGGGWLYPYRIYTRS